MSILLKGITGELLKSIEGGSINEVKINGEFGSGQYIKLSNFEAFLQLLGNSILETHPNPNNIGLGIENPFPETIISFNE